MILYLIACAEDLRHTLVPHAWGIYEFLLLTVLIKLEFRDLISQIFIRSGSMHAKQRTPK